MIFVDISANKEHTSVYKFIRSSGNVNPGHSVLTLCSPLTQTGVKPVGDVAFEKRLCAEDNALLSRPCNYYRFHYCVRNTLDKITAVAVSYRDRYGGLTV